MSKSRNIADIGSNDVLDTNANGIDVTGTVVADGLTVDGGTTNRVASFISTDANALIEFADDTTTNRPAIGAEGNDMTFSTNGEKVRIDSSGNLLVGTTTSTIQNTSGAADGLAYYAPEGILRVRSNATTTLQLNRTSNDGNIAEFRKDGSTVGSIGVNNGVRPYFARPTKAGITIGGASALEPTTDDGTANDNAMDLGGAGARFKDLYLSGSVYLGGTTSANALDDYEEGTWTPTVASGSIGVGKATYTKIGRTCHIILYLSSISSTSDSIGGLPFTAETNAFAPGQGQGQGGTDISLRVGGNSTFLQNKNYSDAGVSLNSWGAFMVFQTTYQVA